MREIHRLVATPTHLDPVQGSNPQSRCEPLTGNGTLDLLAHRLTLIAEPRRPGLTFIRAPPFYFPGMVVGFSKRCHSFHIEYTAFWSTTQVGAPQAF